MSNPATPICELRIDTDRTEPESVSVGGVDLERTDADPTSGEWMVDDGRTLIVVDSCNGYGRRPCAHAHRRLRGWFY